MVVETPFGSQTMSSYLQAPYIYYEQMISELIRPEHRVLELGAGAGLHTRVLLQTGAQVTASDISPNSLGLLKQQFKNVPGNLKTEVADMESLPFDDSSFDVITSAGSLSYGDPILVDTEISRVLRPGGMLICVDSLNHNPVYRANRWLHYMRGNRSKSTLKRMPDLARIRALSKGFSIVNVRFFGAMSFAMPGIARLFGENTARAVSDRIDQLVGVRRSAFKFVVVAQGFA
jgi:ubiquinone/menaquinone biosynthesis C-methylase UbiE